MGVVELDISSESAQPPQEVFKLQRGEPRDRRLPLLRRRTLQLPQMAKTKEKIPPQRMGQNRIRTRNYHLSG